MDHPKIDRQDMDEGRSKLTENGTHDHEKEWAPVIENLERDEPGAQAQAVVAPEVAGSLAGKTIGHYLVGERLGGGAMASVYRAHDQILNRSVALKVLLPNADAVMQERFRREARTVSTLVHPHVVRTIQVGQSAGTIYIAMELVEGSSLAELLERNSKLSVADAAAILAPVAEALAYAHNQGIVHRDVKPSNILLQKANPGNADSVRLGVLPFPVIPLLSDFGIARALDAPELTNAGRTIGTPAFMAPEQCAGSADIDGRADIYGLGAVLYRCVVGRPPFSGSTTQILHAHVYDPLLIPELVAQSLPADAVRIMARAMMKEPAQRYADVALMASDLQLAAELPLNSSEDDSPDFVDSTLTMASLPVAQSREATTSRILVPAGSMRPHVPMKAPAQPKPTTQLLKPTVTAPRAIPVVPPATTRGLLRTGRGRWGMMALGAALLVLLLLLIGTLVNSYLPGMQSDDPDVAVATATSVVVAVVGTSETPAMDDAEQPAVAVGSATPTGSGENAGATPTPSTPTPTPTAVPIPERDLLGGWDNAQVFFEERDWPNALLWLLYVRRVPEFEQERVAEMLTATYIEMATQSAVPLGKWDQALEYLDSALAIAPEDPLLVNLRVAMERLSEATTEETSNAAREVLQSIYQGYAENLAEEGDLCSAVYQLDAASMFLVTEDLQRRQSELTRQCEALDASEQIIESGGSILYSAQENGVYRIFGVPMDGDFISTRLVDEAAQPRISPNGRMLAFYSRREGAEGLFGFALGDNLSPDERSLRYTDSVDDSRDSPPAWSPNGDRLAYGSAGGDNRYRLYVTSADENPGAVNLGYGKDPAWHPWLNLIVANGTDDQGANPGLWLVQADGSGRSILTDNGNDQRPTWSPNGRYVVFMSSRDGNWELYRLDRDTSQILRLTNDVAAQDGLPSISPDGSQVAFMSDRGGRWRLWTVSIDGGEAQLLTEISGQPINWLEHSVQWVP